MAAQKTVGRRPRTLAIDVGGSGLKAIVLDATGKPVTERVRVPTEYPCPPDRLVAALVELVKDQAPYERVSVGFPGVVRDGHVLTAPNLSRRTGPGSPIDNLAHAKWQGFALADVLSKELGKPVRIENDADMQGGAVVSGKGLEVVLTLGTGMGSTVYMDGRLAVHLELAHHPLAKGQTYEGLVGEVARKKIGNKQWTQRVVEAVETVDALLVPDRIYLGGGNAKHLKTDFSDIEWLAHKVTVVDNTAGLLGGIKLWKR
ncbi:MAG: ROK family protein [Actinomycetes bacterium]